VRTLQRLQATSRRARELAAEFRTDIPLRDALMAYAVEADVQTREYLSSGSAAGADRTTRDAVHETRTDAAAPSEYWRRECAFLRERMLALPPNNGRRRVLQGLADECGRLADMLEARAH
jgi:hypothetical protein